MTPFVSDTWRVEWMRTATGQLTAQTNEPLQCGGSFPVSLIAVSSDLCRSPL